MSKFPRMAHLPWSAGGTVDDKRISNVDSFLNRNLVITEKLDGSNLCLRRGGIFSRSHEGPPLHPSFDYAKALHSHIRFDIPEDISIFGEYCYSVHSIKYLSLPSYFLVFAIRDDRSGRWSSWDALRGTAALLGLPVVPVLFRGVVYSKQALEDVTQRLLAESSCYGPDREGVVVRLDEHFQDSYQSIAKCVRPNHVKTEIHWSNQKIVKQGKVNEI